MILLQSKDLFDDVLMFDPETGQYNAQKRSTSPLLISFPISGTFVNSCGFRLMFYRYKSELRFAIDEQTVIITEKTISSLKKKGESATFILKNDDKEELSFQYALPGFEQFIPGDTTPYIDEEDFDFCQFVHNVLTNPERRSFIYNNT